LMVWYARHIIISSWNPETGLFTFACSSLLIVLSVIFPGTETMQTRLAPGPSRVSHARLHKEVQRRVVRAHVSSTVVDTDLLKKTLLRHIAGLDRGQIATESQKQEIEVVVSQLEATQAGCACVHVACILSMRLSPMLSYSHAVAEAHPMRHAAGTPSTCTCTARAPRVPRSPLC
jgi:hypothetical protein